MNGQDVKNIIKIANDNLHILENKTLINGIPDLLFPHGLIGIIIKK